MKADITRSTFRKKKHYRKVNMQQGRVQLDADWNELVDIQVYHDRTSLQDIIGRTGTLIEDAGFEIKSSANGYTIGAGRYYVDGILCENEKEIEAANQKDLPEFGDKNKYAVPKTSGIYLAYLDVWERHLTSLDDPEIREVALGGADTATRTKIVWQVKVFSVGDIGGNYNCLSSFPSWDQEVAESTGTLEARAEPTKPTNEPCELPPGAGYQGIENQLYRVEIHDKGTTNNGATFKWSSDNGIVVAKVTDIVSNENKITVSDTGRDSKLGFAPGQWVEVSDDRRELWGLPGTMVELDEVKDDTLVFNSDTIEGDAITKENFPVEFNPKVRRWDSAGPLKVEIPTPNDGYIELEDGVQVKFKEGTSYRTGDYWLIPARTVEPYVTWPQNGDTADAPPKGIEHHCCRLALLKYYGPNEIEVVSDCREFFPSITDLPIIYYVSGDGQEAAPDSVLLFPLMVYVAINKVSLKNWKVRFKIKVGEGKLGSAREDTTHAPFDATISDTGFVECYWRLDDKNSRQQVEAVLLDADGKETSSPPLYFDATLPISFYYVSGDGQEAAAGSSIELAAGAVIGKTPLQGYKVQFTIKEGNGTLTPTGPVATGSDGIAKCMWKLGTTEKQQVKAVLLNAADQETNLPPLYFNAALGGTAGLSANTGTVTFKLPTGFTTGQEFRSKPIKHELKVQVPPAIILGMTPKVGDNENVSIIEDHGLYDFGKGLPRFKAENINTETFRMRFQVLDNQTKSLTLRWWAIPAEDKGSRSGELETSERPVPTIVFNPDTISMRTREATVITITDANANTDPDKAESIAIILQTGEPRQSMKIQAVETGNNTGIFVTGEIKVVDQDYITVGSGQPTKLTGARPDGKIVATYTAADGQTAQAQVKVVN